MPAAGWGQTPCFDNGGCPGGEYCLKDPGACPGEGTCEALPGGACPTFWTPVCGCDGRTYSNTCYAGQAGVSVDYSDLCVPTGLTAGDGDYNDRVLVSWDAGDPTVGNRVYRAPALEGPYSFVRGLEPGSNTYFDTRPCGASIYYYRVTSYPNGEESDPSTSDSGYAVNRSPVADTGGPYTGDLGDDLTLDASGSGDPDESCGDSLTSHQWDLDDDVQYDDAVGETVPLTWGEIESLVCGGTCSPDTPYDIGLRVEDTNGAGDTDSTTLTLYDNQPTACFDIDPDPADCGSEVTLDASCTSHGRPDRSIVAYRWDLDDDGLYDDAVGETIQRTAANIGAYPVSLEVADDNLPAREDSTSGEVIVTIDNAPPEADAGGPYHVLAGRDILLDATASLDPDEPCGDRIAWYLWDLDNDGFFDDAAAEAVLLSWPEVVSIVCGGLCAEGGEYPLSLKAGDSLGLSDTDTVPVTITYILFDEDFSDGGPAGDDDWEAVTGAWTVTPGGSYRASGRRNNRSLVLGIRELDDFQAGSLEFSFRLPLKSKKPPDVALFFAWSDKEGHRYVRARKKRLVIGQTGVVDGEDPSRTVLPRRFKRGRWYRLRVDLRPDGSVEVFLGDNPSPILGHLFSTAVPGRVGLGADHSRSSFDDFSARHWSVLP
jgi:hypothetical protein